MLRRPSVAAHRPWPLWSAPTPTYRVRRSRMNGWQCIGSNPVATLAIRPRDESAVSIRDRCARPARDRPEHDPTPEIQIRPCRHRQLCCTTLPETMRFDPIGSCGPAIHRSTHKGTRTIQSPPPCAGPMMDCRPRQSGNSPGPSVRPAVAGTRPRRMFSGAAVTVLG